MRTPSCGQLVGKSPDTPDRKRAYPSHVNFPMLGIMDKGDKHRYGLRTNARLGIVSDAGRSPLDSPHGAKKRAARLAAMRLSRVLIPHSRVSGSTLASVATNSTEFAAACAVPQTARVFMKSVSSNSVQEQIKDNLPSTGFVRLACILAPEGPIPVGRSTWWAGIKSGRFPKPVKLGPHTTAWRVEDIRNLIEKAE